MSAISKDALVVVIQVKEDQIAELRGLTRDLTTALEGRNQKIAALEAEVERLKGWVDDLQGGMYVNCVYCGHRYGPGETTPVTMADALKAHVETCSKHPMSILKEALAPFVALAKAADEYDKALAEAESSELDQLAPDIEERVDAAQEALRDQVAHPAVQRAVHDPN